MTSIDFQGIKRAVRISEVLSPYIDVPVGKSRFRIPCPIHNGQDRNFYVDDEKGFCFCHVCHFRGDAIALYAHFHQQKMSDAAKELADKHDLGYSVKDEVKEFYLVQQQLQTLKDARKQLPEVSSLPELVELEDGYRGYSQQTIERFGLKRVADPRWPDAVYIPCRTVDGRLVGYAFRMPEGSKFKYLFSKGFDKKGVMFGLYENQHQIQKRGWALVVEGQFDVLSMYEKGYDNTVGLFSCHMSLWQAHELMKYTTKLVVLFDGDYPDKMGRKAGQEGAVELKEKYGSAFDIKVVELPDGTCVRDLTQEELNNVLGT